MTKYLPSIVIGDYETKLLDGSASTESYRHDFLAVTCAFAWYASDGTIKSQVEQGEPAIRAFLERCKKQGVPLGCFNHQFEYGVTRNRFPGLEDLWEVDAMRLAQMVDNGGPEYEESKPYEPDAWLDEIDEIERKSGLSLDAVISRFLPPEFHGHKQKALELITARGGKKGDLHLLTKDEFLEYNAADAENTLRLYTVLTGILAERQIDWKLDHRLYLSTSRLCSQSKTRGILVDFKALNAHVEAKKTALCKISADFISAHQDAIVKVEEALLERALSRVKTDTAKDKIRADPPRFNTKSTDQLAMLFVDVLGMKPKFKTAKGKPAFGRKLLGQWGSGGLILAKQRTELIELKQGESLLELGGYDGRYHVDIKCAGTRTGRLSGGEQA